MHRSCVRAHTNHQLAEVATRQEPQEGARRILQSLDDVFAVLDLALVQPTTHRIQEIGTAMLESVGDDESAQREALDQNLPHQSGHAAASFTEKSWEW